MQLSHGGPVPASINNIEALCSVLQKKQCSIVRSAILCNVVYVMQGVLPAGAATAVLLLHSGCHAMPSTPSTHSCSTRCMQHSPDTDRSIFSSVHSHHAQTPIGSQTALWSFQPAAAMHASASCLQLNSIFCCHFIILYKYAACLDRGEYSCPMPTPQPHPTSAGCRAKRSVQCSAALLPPHSHAAATAAAPSQHHRLHP